MIELNELRSEKNKIASALKKRGLKDIDTELSKVIELVRKEGWEVKV